MSCVKSLYATPPCTDGVSTFVINNATHTPCAWDDNRKACRSVELGISGRQSYYTHALKACRNEGGLKITLPINFHIVERSIEELPPYSISGTNGLKSLWRPSNATRVLLLYNRWGFSSIYHWVADALFPLITTAMRNGINCHQDTCVAVSVDDQRWKRHSPQLAQFAAAFGIRLSSISQDHIKYDKVIYSTFTCVQPLIWPDVKVPALKWLASAKCQWRRVHDYLMTGAHLFHKTQGTNVVWIHRPSDGTKTDHRSISSKDVLSIAKEYGDVTNQEDELLVIDLATMTVHMQAKLVSTAVILSGLEGAGFILQLWMPLGGSLVIYQFAQHERFPIGFQWAYGQYLREKAVWVIQHSTDIESFMHVSGCILGSLSYDSLDHVDTTCPSYKKHVNLYISYANMTGGQDLCGSLGFS